MSIGVRTALVNMNGAIYAVRRSGYNTNKEFEMELRNQGLKIVYMWAKHKTDSELGVWLMENRKSWR